MLEWVTDTARELESAAIERLVRSESPEERGRVKAFREIRGIITNIRTKLNGGDLNG